MLIELIGALGATLILLAFMMLQFDKWNSKNFWYLITNIIGSTFLVINAVFIKSYPVIVLNAVFALVALKSLIALGNKTK